MVNEIREVLNELKIIRIDIEFIKEHIINADAILTPEEETKLNDSIEEFRQGKTTSFKELEKEIKNA